jgi:squalene synthase HpnC
MSVGHYENFPVASFLLPTRLRPPVQAIYAFARSADDIADEGDATPQERQARLDGYLAELDAIEADATSANKLFTRLKSVIVQHALPVQPFRDLLSAFRQDTHTARYITYDALLDYCSRSANPVGLLMLHLYGAATEENIRMSNAICTALQLINFWQDIAVDWRKDRVYIPQEDLTRFGVTEDMIANGTMNDAWRLLMHFEVRRARELMLSGAALPLRIPGRIGWELRFVVQGGLRILERIESVDFDVFNKRPVLKAADWLHIFWRSLVYPQ